MKQSRLGLFIIPIKFNSNLKTYNDYIDLVVQAERRGYTDVYIGEHLTDIHEDIQASIIFAAAIAARTSTIKINLSVLPLPHYNIRLLIKQLEDLYRLSEGRLGIGFSQGALDSDLNYLGIQTDQRYQLYISKLEELLNLLNESTIILNHSNQLSTFSTLLSEMPFKASALFANGHSALSSNFCHPLHLKTHISCLTSPLSPEIVPMKSWMIGVNLIPIELNKKSIQIIKDSLMYIYSKLSKCSRGSIMSPKTQKLETSTEDHLYAELCHYSLPSTTKCIVSKHNKVFSHFVVNLFDCFDDPCYKEYILSLPAEL